MQIAGGVVDGAPAIILEIEGEGIRFSMPLHESEAHRFLIAFARAGVELFGEPMYEGSEAVH